MSFEPRSTVLPVLVAGVMLLSAASLSAAESPHPRSSSSGASEKLEFSGNEKGAGGESPEALKPEVEGGSLLGDLLRGGSGKSGGVRAGAFMPPAVSGGRGSKPAWAEIGSDSKSFERAVEAAVGVKTADSMLEQLRGDGSSGASSRGETTRSRRGQMDRGERDRLQTSVLSGSGDLSGGINSLQPVFDAGWRIGGQERSRSVGVLGLEGGVAGNPGNPMMTESGELTRGLLGDGPVRQLRDLFQGAGTVSGTVQPGRDRWASGVSGSDPTREILNPTQPWRDSLSEMAPSRSRRNADSLQPVFGFSGSALSGSGPSPLRQMMETLQGPASASGAGVGAAAAPEAETRSRVPKVGTLELPTRPF